MGEPFYGHHKKERESDYAMVKVVKRAILEKKHVSTWVLGLFILSALLASVQPLTKSDAAPFTSLTPTPTVVNTPVLVYSAVFSHNGNYILTGNTDGAVQLWDAKTTKLIRTIIDRPRYTINVTFSLDDKYIYTFSNGGISANDGLVRMWETDTGKKLRQFNGLSSPEALLDNGTLLISDLTSASARIVDTTTGTVVKTLAHSYEYSVVSRDGQYAITWGFPSVQAQLWDVNNDRLLHTFPSATSSGIGDVGFVTAMAFSPDGTQAAIRNEFGGTNLWNLKTFDYQKVGIAKRGGAVAFSPSGHELFLGNSDGTIQVWDIVEHRLKTSIVVGKNNFESPGIEVSADGTQLLINLGDEPPSIWNIITWEKLRSFGNN